MKYEDLLTVPYKEFGRDKSGMDCYGYVIELCKRAGTPLKDVAILKSDNKEISDIPGAFFVNVKEIKKEEAIKGDIVCFRRNNELHIGYLLDSKTVTHMTYRGVRITPITYFSDAKFGRII